MNFVCQRPSSQMRRYEESSYLPTYEDGTDRVFQKNGIQNSDVRKANKFRTWQKFEIKCSVLFSSTIKIWHSGLGNIRVTLLT